jgi:hypothetical protein
MLACGVHAGAVVAEIIRVCTIDNDRQAEAEGYRLELRIKLGFAVITAIRGVLKKDAEPLPTLPMPGSDFSP